MMNPMKKISTERTLYIDFIEHIHNVSGRVINQMKLTKSSYLIMVTVDANITFVKNNKIYEMHPGQMICCKPYDVFEYFASMPQNVVYNVQFYSDSKMLDTITEGVYTLNKECTQAFYDFFKKGEESFHSGMLPMTVKKNQPSPLEQQMIINMLEYAILLSCNSMVLDKGALAYVDKFSEEVLVFQKVVKTHVTEWLTAPEIATLCNMSLSNLKKHVAEFFPEGIKTFFMKEKINYAVKLLLSGKRVNEVSQILSFPTTYYFSTVFKRFTGMSPTEYKKSRNVNWVIKHDEF